MQKIDTFLVFLLFAFTLSSAQNNHFTLDEVISGGKNYNALRPQKLKNLTWLADEESYSFTDSIGLHVINAANSKQSGLLSTQTLNNLLDTNFRIFPPHSWSNNRTLSLFTHNKSARIDVSNNTLIHTINLPAKYRNGDFSPDHTKIAFTVGNNLYVTDVHTEKTDTITFDSLDGIVNGQTVHRSEFGIRKGTFWSDNGVLLAFYKKDETRIPKYQMLDYSGKYPSICNTRYAFAGGVSEEVQIGIYNTLTHKTTYLTTVSPKDRYFTNISWSPNASTLFVAELNRDQNHMELKSYDSSTGNLLGTLFEEKNSTYVEPEYGLNFSPKNPSIFIWQSERDGHNHLYLYSTKGKLKKQLTKGNWDVTQLLDWDEQGESVYFESTKNSPLDRTIYQVNLKSGNISALIDTPGVHNVQLSPTKKYLLDEWSSQFVPQTTNLYALNQDTIRSIEIHKSENPYANYDLGKTEIITLKSTDGTTDLYARLIKPTNFDPTKKYPVIVYVYGGPHSQQVSNRWMAQARMWQHFMAQKGYISFTLDNRGSAGRGQAFEEIIHRQLGVIEMQDQLAGIEYLKEQTFVDSSRIGIHGWSFGGFMTISLMTSHPEIFKIGVAGGPVIRWELYEIMYGERYMDSPEQNPEGYSKSNLLLQSQNLKNKLLIIHGNMDSTVVLQHSIEFVEKCIDENIPIDFFIYPNHPHNIIGPNQVHLMNKVSSYFFDNL